MKISLGLNPKSNWITFPVKIYDSNSVNEMVFEQEEAHNLKITPTIYEPDFAIGYYSIDPITIQGIGDSISPSEEGSKINGCIIFTTLGRFVSPLKRKDFEKLLWQHQLQKQKSAINTLTRMFSLRKFFKN